MFACGNKDVSSERTWFTILSLFFCECETTLKISFKNNIQNCHEMLVGYFPKYFLKWGQKAILTEWLEKTHTNLKL